MAEALDQAEAFARIRLLRSPNIGPVSYAQLLMRFGSAVQALEALPELGSRGGRVYRAAPAQSIEREIEAVRSAGAKYLFHDQPGYPALLALLDSAPPILTWRGDLALASRPCVALVGAISPRRWRRRGSPWCRASRAGSTARRMKGPSTVQRARAPWA